MTTRQQVKRWALYGLLTACTGWVVALFFSTVSVQLGIFGFGLALFIFPGWPLLQFTAGFGPSIVFFPIIALSSNMLLYGASAYLWFGPGSQVALIRNVMRVAVLTWFAYSVLWPRLSLWLS